MFLHIIWMNGIVSICQIYNSNKITHIQQYIKHVCTIPVTVQIVESVYLTFWPCPAMHLSARSDASELFSAWVSEEKCVQDSSPIHPLEFCKHKIVAKVNSHTCTRLIHQGMLSKLDLVISEATQFHGWVQLQCWRKAAAMCVSQQWWDEQGHHLVQPTPMDWNNYMYICVHLQPANAHTYG
jgi:hypothetical protein